MVATRKPTNSALTALRLPSHAKYDLCMQMLTEFGARNISVKGNEIQHSCCLPFGHTDNNPSASLNFEKMTYRCWACGSGGLLWWIATMQSTDNFSTVKEWISNRVETGKVDDTQTILDFLESLNTTDIFSARPMPHYDERVLEAWDFIHPYMTDIRKIPIDNIRKHRTGYGVLRVPVGSDASGKTKYIDSPRITIPHFWEGKLVGWQSRRLVKDGSAKYLNTPDFPKDMTLYNHKVGGEVVVVESPMSVVAHSHQVHMEATFGAMVTQTQNDLICRHDKIILWMDNDHAGWNATESVGAFAAQRTGSVFVVDCPYSADPADLDDETFAMGLKEWCIPWALYTAPSTLRQWERADHVTTQNGFGASNLG